MANATFNTAPAQNITLRKQQVPAADFDGGGNLPASCSPGIGINIDGGSVVGEAQQFTLLDQDGAARTPQVGQILGTFGNVGAGEYPSSGGQEGKGVKPIEAGLPSDEGDGTVTLLGDATLASLAAGWTAVPVP